MCGHLAGRTEIGTTVIARILVRRLAVLRFELRQGPLGIGSLCLPHLADPGLEFVVIEVAITAVGERGEGAVCECKKCGVSALGRPFCIPRSRDCAHPLYCGGVAH